MCDLCFHSPCVSNCPNAPEPEAVYTCDHCGGGIYDGDKYYQIDDIIDVRTLLICEDCMNDFKRYAEYEPFEADGCDIYKARIEKDMCNDN